MAVVAGSRASNRTVGSVRAREAAAGWSPVNAGRYVACCSSVPHSDSAVATEPLARVATAMPRSPQASASATRVPVIAVRSSERPPSDSGTPRMGSPISLPAARTSGGVAQAVSASAAAGRTTSVASSVTTSTSICSSSVGVRSKTPLAGAAPGRVPALPRLPAVAKARPAVVAVRKPAAGDREDGALGVLADAEAVEELALGQLVHGGHRVAERVAAVAGGDSERGRGPAGGGHGGTVTLSYSCVAGSVRVSPLTRAGGPCGRPRADPSLGFRA